MKAYLVTYIVFGRLGFVFAGERDEVLLEKVFELLGKSAQLVTVSILN